MFERYWCWNYELKDLGSWPGEEYKGHNHPVEVVVYRIENNDAVRGDRPEWER